ncbi:acyl-CoA synthetase [Sphingobium sp. V4]|uniref:acyl-CoA synthetase n=1 Tax=Sphingobium sp. V4 TaxID=3038927 RepID=UPI002557DFC4|nr:acyl-CoA synthetase [Sphingobium sp. V4]WIW89521.1 acyl-CoA synthetase [Sphingobium sp. V4]
MHPSCHAETRPDAIAVRFEPSGRSLTYRDLDSRSAQLAHFFRSLGLGKGDVVALLLENEPALFELTWAAQRIGVYYVCVPTRLTSSEITYMLADSGAVLLFASSSLCEVAVSAITPLPSLALWSTGPNAHGVPPYMPKLDDMPEGRPANECAGSDLLYSSGTTGRPKGVKPPLDYASIFAPTRHSELGGSLYGMNEATVFLSPAPLYHAAPLRWCMGVMRIGGTCIAMEHFDAELALGLIDRHRVTHAQWVPTHFVRLLRLPEATRSRYAHDSLRAVFHAAAPCPVEIKRQMLDWWGPIIHEYYSGTEAFGMTAISPEEWLAKPGSVGRSILGEIRICDENDNPLPSGSEGVVYFEGGPATVYHNAPEKDAEVTNTHGWRTYGDVGWTDEEGFLYLTDRRSFMIVTGGVNVYPQETENVLATHPSVADVAVIGVPNTDLGEEVKAVVLPVDPAIATSEFAEELIAWTRERISPIKAPRSVDFVTEMPRQPTGKLHKRLLRDRYLQQ